MKFDELTDWEKGLIKYARITREIRPDILDFAYEMEMTMRANDGKKGDSYKYCSLSFLVNKVDEEFNEFVEASNEMKPEGPTTEPTKKECVDLANCAMMVWTRG